VYLALLWQYRRFITLLIIVVVIQIFELALLHFKYTIFTGGFLQQFSYQTYYDRFVFFSITCWFDGILFGVFAMAWFHVADKYNRNGMISYYNFIVTCLLITGGWLAIKFEVLSYFNDTVNFQIIKNISGGSFRNSLLYVSNEVTLFLSVFIAFCIFVFLGARVISKFEYEALQEKTKSAGIYPIFFFALLMTPLITFYVSETPHLRYGLSKKTSYQLVERLLDTVSDFDLDGAGYFSIPKDKDNFDSLLYPGALDIPGNGIDEDGFLGDAVFPIDTPDQLKRIAHKKGKHIVLIVLESARADLLDKKIKGKFVAPVLREIAKYGFHAEFAYSHTGFTTTSMKAIFNRSLTGEKKVKLIDFLYQSGYQITIISGQDESFGGIATKVGMNLAGVNYFDARTAIDDRVYVSKEPSSLRLSEERIVQQFKHRISQQDFTEPQFTYLNFQAAHFPYSHPKMEARIKHNSVKRSNISLANKTEVEETYWNAIANADWAVGEVFKMLEQYKILDNTTVLLLGDHGESLFENGFLGHGYAINDTQTKIPLIMNTSDISITEAIGQVDVAEILIRSAFGIKNSWNNKEKVVFQLTGGLDSPVLIAHVKGDGQRILFDFRTEQIYVSEIDKWIPFKEAIEHSKYKGRVEHLIRDWEGLRWKSYLARKAS